MNARKPNSHGEMKNRPVLSVLRSPRVIANRPNRDRPTVTAAEGPGGWAIAVIGLARSPAVMAGPRRPNDCRPGAAGYARVQEPPRVNLQRSTGVPIGVLPVGD